MFKVVGGWINVDPSAKCDSIQDELKSTVLWQRRRLNEGPATPEIRYAAEEEGDRRLPYTYKVKSDDQKKEDFDMIKHVTPQYFIIALSLVGLALCWKLYIQNGCPDFAKGTFECDNHSELQWEGLGVFAAVVLCIVLVLMVLKLIKYPLKVAKDWDHPLRSNAFALLPLNLLAHSFLLVGTKHDDVGPCPVLLGLSGIT